MDGVNVNYVGKHTNSSKQSAAWCVSKLDARISVFFTRSGCKPLYELMMTYTICHGWEIFSLRYKLDCFHETGNFSSVWFNQFCLMVQDTFLASLGSRPFQSFHRSILLECHFNEFSVSPLLERHSLRLGHENEIASIAFAGCDILSISYFNSVLANCRRSYDIHEQ